VQVAGWLGVADFVMVQDYFMTETAKQADIILPASFPIESGGSFTNTQKVIQGFEAHFTAAVEKTGLEQVAEMLRARGIEQKSSEPAEVLSEAHKLLALNGHQKYTFHYTYEDDENRMYRHGCDHIVKRFDEEFVMAFENAKKLAYERI